jgi:hypothetical protein
LVLSADVIVKAQFSKRSYRSFNRHEIDHVKHRNRIVLYQFEIFSPDFDVESIGSVFELEESAIPLGVFEITPAYKIKIASHRQKLSKLL